MFFKVFGDQNESLRLIIIDYMFRYKFGMKTTLLESHQSQKKPFNGSVSVNLVIMTLF